MWRMPSPPHLDSLAAHGKERLKRKKAQSCSQATGNTTIICGEGEVIVWQVQREKRAMISGYIVECDKLGYVRGWAAA